MSGTISVLFSPVKQPPLFKLKSKGAQDVLSVITQSLESKIKL